MNSFIPLTMSASNGVTAGACGCKKATAASDIRSNGHLAQANAGGTLHNSHRATQTTTGNGGSSNHSATQTNGHISDAASRFHSSAPVAIEPSANNDHVNSPGLWTRPATMETLAMQLEEEKRKRCEAEQSARELLAELTESKMEASQAKKELFKTQTALSDHERMMYNAST